MARRSILGEDDAEKVMVEQFTDVWLGVEALKYLIECLEAGGPLSRALLKSQDFASGSIRTRLPSGTTAAMAEQIEEGGKTKSSGEEGTFWGFGTPHRMVRISDTLDELAKEIHTSLRSAARSCLLENELAVPSDPVLASYRSRMIICGASVYHLVCPDDDLGLVRAAIREARSATFFVGVISGYRFVQCSPLASAVSSIDELADCAAQALAVMVSAYDGESYLVWEPTGSGVSDARR